MSSTMDTTMDEGRGGKINVPISASYPGGTNPNMHAMSTGSVKNNFFTVCCCGSSLLVMDRNLKTIQEIVEDGVEVFKAVDSCHSDGKLAVCTEQKSGTKIVIYRPTHMKDGSSGFPYRWHRMATLPTASACATISWNPLGDRFVVGGEHITAWWHKAIATESADMEPYSFAADMDPLTPYAIESSRPIASPVKFLTYSPDGRVFASAADNDRLIKVWYTLPQELVRVSPLYTSSFIYLEHPQAVTAFSWRKVSDHKMHSNFVKNVLVSSCDDMVCRIWSETDGQDPLGFYLTTVIDPSIYSGLETIKSSFTLHWLNTKDLRHELLERTDKMHSNVPDLSGVDTFAPTPSTTSPPRDTSSSPTTTEQVDDFVILDVPKAATSTNKAAVIYRQFDVDGRDFAGDGAACHTQIAFRRGQMGSIHKPYTSSEPEDSWPDVLFFVNTDGSLIFWSIGHLDEHPRRDPSVKYISRTDVGIIPPIDASSITGNVVVFSDADVSNWKRCVAEKSIDSGQFEYSCRKSLSMALLMHHKTGDVTKWCTAFADNSSFSDVLRVEESSRCTGHSVPVHTIQSHPNLSHVLTVGNDFFGIEAMVWSVSRDSSVTPQCDSVLHTPCVYRCKLENDESSTVFCWIPSSKYVALVKSTATGIHIIGISPESIKAERSLSVVFDRSTGTESYTNWHSIWAQSGPTQDGEDCFWVYGLHGNGSTMSVWRVTVAASVNNLKIKVSSANNKGAAKPKTVVFDAFLIERFELGVETITSSFMFLHTTDYIEEALFSGERCSYFGVVTNQKQLLVWDLKCNLDFYGKSTVEIEAVQVTKGDSAEFEARSIVCSLGGVLAISREHNNCSIELAGFQVTGVGLDTIETLSFTDDVYSMSWGATHNWKDALLVLTSKALSIYIPRTHSLNPGSYAMVVSTNVSANSIPTSLVSHTAAGVVLIVTGKSLRAQSVWDKTEFFPTKAAVTTVDHTEAEHSDPPPCDQLLTTVDQLLSSTQNDLPQYHPLQLTQFLLSGQRLRIQAILKHIAACFRNENTSTQDDAVASVSAMPSTHYNKTKEKEFMIPPVSLDKVWHVEDDSSTTAATSEDNYDDLFMISIDGHANTTTSGSKEADYICEQLAYKSLPGLSRLEQAATAALLESTAEIDQNRQSLDECGICFFVPLLQKTISQRAARRSTGGYSPLLEPSAYVWALHSNSQERLLELCPGIGKNPSFLWDDFRAVGAGYWVQNTTTLKTYCEQIAKNTFQKQGNTPLDAALWYCAMKKKSVLWGLFKSVGDQRMASFFGNNFTEKRWKDAAANNGFKLLSLQRYHHSVAFFLLGDKLEEAAHICKKNLNDPQLAIVLSRLYHDGESSACLEAFLAEECVEETDPFAKSILHWLQKDYTKSFSDLLNTTKDLGGDVIKRNAPAILHLYSVLQTKNQVKSAYTAKGQPNKITEVPVVLFFKAFQSYVQQGMPLLALDTLAKYNKAEEEAVALAEIDKTTEDVSQPAFKARLFAPKAAVLLPSVTMDTGMIDFGSFGGFDEFSQFDSPAPTTNETEDNTNVKHADDDDDDDVAGANPTWKVGRNVVLLWKWQLCLRIVSQGIVDSNDSSGVSWVEFNESLEQQATAVASICGREVDSCSESIRKVALQLAKSHSLSSLELMLQPHIRAPEDTLAFVERLVDELIAILVDLVQAYSDDSTNDTRVNASTVCARAKILADQVSTCLLQMTTNNLVPAACPSACQLSEFVCVVYATLVFVAWKEKDTASLLQLYSNVPNSRLWDHLVPGASNPIDAEHLIKTSDDTTTASPLQNCRSLMSFVKKPVSAGLYVDVDGGADWALDGSEVFVTIHPVGSAEYKIEQFRWYLMDFTAAQYAVEMLRDVVKSTVSIEVSVLDKVSLKLHRILEAMEEFTAVAQLKLCSISAPFDQALLSETQSDAKPAHSLFKIRKIREIKHNIFQPIHARRLWDFIVRQPRLQQTLVHHLLARPSRTFTDAARVGDWITARHEATEIFCLCNVSRHADALVVGTAKGIVELHLKEQNEEGIVPPNLLTSTTPSFGGIRGGASSPSFDIPVSRSVSPRTTQLQPEDPTAGDAEIYVQGQVRPSQGQIRSLAQHPNMPCYISGTSQGDIQLWHFNQQYALGSFRTDKKDQLNALKFSAYGNTFGGCNSGGDMMLWRFLSGDDSDDPFLTIKANSKRTDDFEFLCSTSLLVTGGWSSDGGNVNLWDTMLISTDRFSVAHSIRSYDCNEGGTRALAYSPTSQRLICGSHKGEIAVIDFRQQAIIKSWMAHEGSVNKLIIDEAHDAIISGSSSGDVKLWSLNSLRQTANYEGLHARSTFFKSGVVDMALQGNKLLTCGIDGNIKLSVPWNTHPSRLF